MTSGKVFRAFVDRIEGDKAVLLVGEHEEWQLILPKELLPEAAGEGSVLVVTIRHDEKQSAHLSEQVRKQIEGLTGPGE